MRNSLRSLAGQRARFAATFSEVSKGGNILLRDLRGPAGQEDHIYIPFRRWPGKLMLPETEFFFSARVGAYDREDGSWDLGLLELVIEGQQ
jgi:hypothetical protein